MARSPLRDEVLTGLVGLQAERLEPLGGRLLRGDVAADAASALLPFFGRLDDDGRRNAVGADLHLGVAVDRREGDVRVDERPARAHAEGGLEVHDSATVSSSGSSAPTSSATRGRPSMMTWASSLTGSAMVGERSKRMSAAGEVRLSSGRAMPSDVSTCHPGAPSYHPP